MSSCCLNVSNGVNVLPSFVAAVEKSGWQVSGAPLSPWKGRRRTYRHIGRPIHEAAAAYPGLCRSSSPCSSCSPGREVVQMSWRRGGRFKVGIHNGRDSEFQHFSIRLPSEAFTCAQPQKGTPSPPCDCPVECCRMHRFSPARREAHLSTNLSLIVG